MDWKTETTSTMNILGNSKVVNDKFTKAHFVLWAVFCVVSFLLLCALSTVKAADGINKQLTFYGVLKASSGSTVADGDYDMVFKIYEAASGGTALWTGTHTTANGNAVEVKDSNFVAMLGSGTGNAMTLDFTSDTFYVGITVGTDSEMTPRQRIGASAYSFNADAVDGSHIIKTTSNPEGSETGSVGDIALDITNQKMYLKISGSGTNTGWANLNAGSGKYVGKTTSSYSGTITSGSYVGYQAVNDICAAQYTDSHICSTDEILLTIATENFSAYTSHGDVWIAEGPPGYTASSNDCDAWTASDADNLGPFWDWDFNAGGGRGRLTPCTSTLPLACCK